MRSPKKALKTQTEYDIVRPIAEGSFNCAHIIRRNNGEEQILRVAMLPKDARRTFANMMVKRGIQIVNVFQPFASLLGPSLLRETNEFEFRQVKLDELRLDRKLLCKTIINAARAYDKHGVPYEFAIQVIELLHGGACDHDAHVKMTQEERVFACFSLCWFFHHAQSRFDFGHHDLKPDNVIFRLTDVPLMYTFRIADRQFKFTSRYVPVVIDYDFATVFTSRDPRNKDAAGTPSSVSPDAMIRTVLLNTSATTQEDAKQELPDVMAAHDWWSIGVMLLQFHLPHQAGSFFRLYDAFKANFVKPRMAYAKHVYDIIEKQPQRYTLTPDNSKMVATALSYFPIACLLACLAEDGDTLEPPADCPSYVHRDVFFDNMPLLDSFLQTLEYQELRTEYAKLTRGLRDILRMLLSWYPERRSYMGRPYMFLFESYFRSFEQATSVESHYHFDGEAKGLLEDAEEYVKVLDTTQYPLLASCVTCGIGSKIASLCECCDQIFCGEKCQEKHFTERGASVPRALPS